MQIVITSHSTMLILDTTSVQYVLPISKLVKWSSVTSYSSCSNCNNRCLSRLCIAQFSLWVRGWCFCSFRIAVACFLDTKWLNSFAFFVLWFIRASLGFSNTSSLCSSTWSIRALESSELTEPISEVSILFYSRSDIAWSYIIDFGTGEVSVVFMT
jgi:hypothetical protein